MAKPRGIAFFRPEARPAGMTLPTFTPPRCGRSRKRWALVALPLALGTAAGALAAPAGAVGPYPDLGSCQVFPDPPASLSPQAPSLPNEAAWNQDISQAPRDPRSAAYIAYIDSHGGDHLHPDFGSPRPYGFPYAAPTGSSPAAATGAGTMRTSTS